jgi:hypothetical protein
MIYRLCLPRWDSTQIDQSDWFHGCHCEAVCAEAIPTVPKPHPAAFAHG